MGQERREDRGMKTETAAIEGAKEEAAKNGIRMARLPLGLRRGIMVSRKSADS